VISDVAEDIVEYIELPHLQNHILAIDDPSLHSTLQVLELKLCLYHILASKAYQIFFKKHELCQKSE
jgi:hypothetical protein